MIDKQFFISSCDDMELGIKRNSKLEYRLSSPQNPKAIFFIIGGFGTNTDLRIMDFTRKQIASKFGVAAVNVLYHCFCCRRNDLEQQYSAQIAILEEDKANLIKLCQDIGLPYANLTSTEALKFIEESIQKEKKKGNLAKDFRINTLTHTLLPPNEEYQNYGIMAALDHINVLKHLKTHGGGGGKLPVIYAGGCYGGYLAHLIAKIAPHHTNAVIDIACAPLPFFEMFMGRTLGHGEFFINTDDFSIHCFTKTFWNENNFTKAHYEIRSLLTPSHLQIQKTHCGHIHYVSYHSSEDEFETAKDKKLLYEIYEKMGFKAKLHLAKKEDIDHKIIRDLTHGGISNHRVFLKELPSLLKEFEGGKFPLLKDSISYVCEDKTFTFKDEGETYCLRLD